MTSITLIAALAMSPLPQSVSIDDVWQANLRDASFTARIVQASRSELSKINKDFATSFQLLGNTAPVRLKEPFKLRIETKEGDTTFLFIVNGTTRVSRAPKANISVRQNLDKSPGKRQTILDFGLLAPSLFRELFKAEFVRMDRATGHAVFDLTYFPNLRDTSRQRIWVDRDRKFIAKREWYAQQDKRLLATFTYLAPIQDGGIWAPTRLEVRNADNKLAGVMAYEQMKLNTGLAESLFAVN